MIVLAHEARAKSRPRILLLERLLGVMSTHRMILVSVPELRQVLPLLHNFFVDDVDPLIDQPTRMVGVLSHEVVLTHCFILSKKYGSLAY